VVWAFTVGDAQHGGGHTSRYDLPAPIVAAAWRRLGYEPLVIVVAEDEQHAARLRSRNADGIGAVVELRAMHVKVLVTVPAKGKSPGQTGQLVRMAAVVLDDLWDAEAVVVTDADMMPLSLPYFLQARPHKMTVFNYGILPDQFAMCYLQAPASIWRDVLGFRGGQPLVSPSAAVEAIFAETGEDGWGTDQIVITERIKQWSGWPARSHTVDVPTWQHWRLDRMDVGPAGAFDERVEKWSSCEVPATDFHMPYLWHGDCHGAAHNATSRVMRRLFDSHDLARLSGYLWREMCA